MAEELNMQSGEKQEIKQRKNERQYKQLILYRLVQAEGKMQTALQSNNPTTATTKSTWTTLRGAFTDSRDHMPKNPS